MYVSVQSSERQNNKSGELQKEHFLMHNGTFHMQNIFPSTKRGYSIIFFLVSSCDFLSYWTSARTTFAHTFLRSWTSPTCAPATRARCDPRWGHARRVWRVWPVGVCVCIRVESFGVRPGEAGWGWDECVRTNRLTTDESKTDSKGLLLLHDLLEELEKSPPT